MNERPGISHATVIVLLAVGMPALCAAQAADELSQCSRLEDDTERLACYDVLSGKDVPTAGAPESQAPAPAETNPAPAAREEATSVEAPAATPAAGVAAAGAAASDAEADAGDYAPLTDDVGAEAPEFRPVRTRVTDCRKDHSGKYYFFFENGQVWKQRDSSRLYFRDCDFEVTITKDFFGYKMQVAGEDGETRIGRIK